MLKDEENLILALIPIVVIGVVLALLPVLVKAAPPVMEHHPCRTVRTNMERLGSFTEKEIIAMQDRCMRATEYRQESREKIFTPEYRADWSNFPDITIGHENTK